MKQAAIVELSKEYLEKEIEVYTPYGIYAGEWYEVDLHANTIGIIAPTSLGDMQRRHKIDIASISSISVMENK